MEKQKVDALIAVYLPKIYSFADKKAFSYEEAEELAAEMTAEVYRSLRKREEICSLEGYIRRICEHTALSYAAVCSDRKDLRLYRDRTSDAKAAHDL